jgi:predicted RNA binding protein YcfA (HicA-like mRNA interferase family)
LTQREKLLSAARENPAGLRFAEFETLLAQCGWTLKRQRGSHRVWYSPQGARLSVQENEAGKAKPYQVRQFLAVHQRENP